MTEATQELISRLVAANEGRERNRDAMQALAGEAAAALRYVLDTFGHVPNLSGLTAADFGDDTALLLDDGSVVFFRYSFLAEEGDYFVVYSEHGGYHTFFKPVTTVISAGQRRTDEEKEAMKHWEAKYHQQTKDVILSFVQDEDLAEKIATALDDV